MNLILSSRFRNSFAWIAVIGLIFHTSRTSARDMATDRPDGTESPISLEPGRFQVEMSLFSFTTDDHDGTKLEAWSFGETNFKIGVTDASDIQFVFSPYVTERVKSAGTTETVDGFGDIEVRYKWNLFGNDEGDTAFGLLPYVKIPSGSEVSNDHVEGGVIVPFAWDFAEGWGFGAQVQLDRVYQDDDNEYGWEFGHTAVVGKDITESVGAFLEYLGVVGEGFYQAYASGGFTWLLNENLQLDIAAVAGLNADAEDFTIFQGFSYRF